MGVTCTVCRISAARFGAAGKEALLAALRDDPNAVDLDKAWDGILWLVCAENRDEADPARPETEALLPPDAFEVDGMAVGFAAPEDVRRIAAALATLDEPALRARFDGAAMTAASVYPEIWADEPKALDYVLSHFAALRELYRDAAASGDYVVVQIA